MIDVVLFVLFLEIRVLSVLRFLSVLLVLLIRGLVGFELCWDVCGVVLGCEGGLGCVMSFVLLRVLSVFCVVVSFVRSVVCVVEVGVVVGVLLFLCCELFL